MSTDERDLWKRDEPEAWKEHEEDHTGRRTATGVWVRGFGEYSAIEYECIFCQLEYEAGEREAP